MIPVRLDLCLVLCMFIPPKTRDRDEHSKNRQVSKTDDDGIWKTVNLSSPSFTCFGINLLSFFSLPQESKEGFVCQE